MTDHDLMCLISIDQFIWLLISKFPFSLLQVKRTNKILKALAHFEKREIGGRLSPPLRSTVNTFTGTITRSNEQKGKGPWRERHEALAWEAPLWSWPMGRFVISTTITSLFLFLYFTLSCCVVLNLNWSLFDLITAPPKQTLLEPYLIVVVAEPLCLPPSIFYVLVSFVFSSSSSCSTTQI